MTRFLDPDALQAFVTIARAGSFGRAAVELDQQQPGLSRQIKRLEAKLGVELLARHTRGVRLTDVGTVLLQHAERILQQLDAAAERVRAHLKTDAEPARTPGTPQCFAIGLSTTVATVIAPMLLRRFRALWPQSTLTIRTGDNEALEHAVLDERLDAGLYYDPIAVDALDIQSLVSERLVLVGSPQVDQGNAAPVQMRDLARLPLILPGVASGTRRIVSRAASRLGIKLQPSIEVDDLQTIKALVGSGLGYTVLSFAAVHEEVARGALLVRSIEGPELPRDFVLAMSSKQGATPLPQPQQQAVGDVMTAIVQSGAWGDATRHS